MISGGEMGGLYPALMQRIMQVLTAESQDHASINQAARDSINKIGVYHFVYPLFNPSRYNRRFSAGGIADDGNLYTTTGSGGTTVTINFEDKTPENGDGLIIPDPAHYVSDLVEEGAYGTRWPGMGFPWSRQPPARPYMENSLQNGANPGGITDMAIEDAVRNITVSW